MIEISWVRFESKNEYQIKVFLRFTSCQKQVLRLFGLVCDFNMQQSHAVGSSVFKFTRNMVHEPVKDWGTRSVSVGLISIVSDFSFFIKFFLNKCLNKTLQLRNF